MKRALGLVLLLLWGSIAGLNRKGEDPTPAFRVGAGQFFSACAYKIHS